MRFSGPIVNLTLVTSHVSLTHMHVQNLFFNDYSLTLFLLGTHFFNSKLTFLTRNSLFLLETCFPYSKLTFLTRNSLFLLETYFSNSKLSLITRNFGKYCQQGTLVSPSVREHINSPGHNENDKLFWGLQLKKK